MKQKPKYGSIYFDSYPYNLMDAVDSSQIDAPVTEDQINGIEYALNQLGEREKEILILRYKDRQTYDSIAEKYGITRGRIQQLEAKAIRKLRAPAFYNAIFYGLELARKQSKVYEKELELNRRWSALLRNQELLRKNPPLHCGYKFVI